MLSDVTAVDGDRFFHCIESYLPAHECHIVREAYELARREHGDQLRKSGELFFVHPLTIAYYLAQFQLDYQTLVAALLHDVAEDTRVSIADIKKLFGDEVGQLVDAVTKFNQATAVSKNGSTLTKEQLMVATLHKLLQTTVDDVRAIIIKLFDRLHNLRTIGAMRYESKMRTAQETLSIYAPIANRLGMWELMNELGCLSLKVAQPEAFHQIESRLSQIRKKNEPHFEVVQQQIYDCLLSADIDVRDVVFARENIYTIYQRIEQGEGDIDDRLRIVVLVNSWPDCYKTLGHLHQLWTPVPDNFADYIAVPRDNLYQSLHTTVIHTSGQHIRIRIRTVDMDKVSAIGILTSWLYRGTNIWPKLMDRRVRSFQGTIDSNIRVEPHDFNASVRSVIEDVLRKQIHVYTPEGDVIELGYGATPLDFAYAIHTVLGDQCSGAKVNGSRYRLNKPLKNGDQVHIMRRESSHPSRAWLDEDLGFLATNYARNHVRRWFRRLPYDQTVRDGERILHDELKMLGKSNYFHEDIARHFDFNSVEELYYQLGRAELLPTTLSTRLLENEWDEISARSLDNVVYAPNGEKYIITNADGRKLNLCGTCKPYPGDVIVGYLRMNNQVTVHQESCHLLMRHRKTERWMKLDWGHTAQRVARVSRIQIDVYDRHGLLYEITQLMHREQINIPHVHTQQVERSGNVRMTLDLEVTSPRQLVRILHQVRALVNVYRVRCLLDDYYSNSELLRPSLYRPE